MDVDGEAIDAVRRHLARPGGARDGRGDPARPATGGSAFLGTKMPLDYRARKRLEGFRARLAEAGVGIEDQEFYEGGSALLKGREMTAGDPRPQPASSTSSTTPTT